MRILRQLAVVGALAGASFASAARAQSLDWSYTFGNGDVVSGVFTGTDAGNYFTVTGLQSLSVNGVATTYLAGVPIISADSYAGSGGGYNGNSSAVVTLDGSYMDLVDTPDDVNGLLFAAGDAFARDYYAVFSAVLPPVANDGESYVQTSWSAMLVGTQVAEPSTAAVLLTGLVGLAMARGRKVV
jgi:hypothetical protein